jgi:hypothetical protein
MKNFVWAFGLVATLAACSPQLDSSHPGWKQPDCWTSGCHDPKSTMKSQDMPYQCAECHDSNGAPAGHRLDSPSPCAPCHGEKHGGPARGFVDIVSCRVCHG